MVNNAPILAGIAAVSVMAMLSRTKETIEQEQAAINDGALRYFSLDEFGNSLAFLDPALLFALDQYRHILGKPIHISPAEGSLARFYGSKTSQHYAVDRLATAADIMPEGDIERAYQVAKDSGLFGGIGVYPDWQPRAGLHVDIRPRKDDGSIATWSGIKVAGGETAYFPVNRAFT